MIKYFTLCLSLSLSIFYTIQPYDKKNYIPNFYTYSIHYKENNNMEDMLRSGGANDIENTDNSCYGYCIIYLLVSLIIISVLIYYCYRQLRKRRQSIQKKDNIIKRMEEDMEDINEMVETSKISNQEILRIYKLMVRLAISPQKNRHQKFLLDYNSFIYNSDDTFQFNWVTFEILLNNISNRYVDKLRSLFSNLSEKEVQVVAMQKAGFEIPDIAVILEYSVNTVYKRNSDIRKKLNVPESGNIIYFIDQKLGENT